MDSKKGIQKQLLGEILIERKLITEDQLAQALEVQRKEKGYIGTSENPDSPPLSDESRRGGQDMPASRAYLGEILVKLGFLEELDVVTALVVQCNFPYIAVDKYEIDKNIIELIPKDFAVRNLVIALDRVGDILSVVMNNPLDTAVRAEIQRLTNYRIAPFIATRLEIEKAVTHWYGEKSDA